jgi:SulP family sulfate permease
MFLPRLPWTDSHSRGDFRNDVFAGLTTAVMLVPQAMAYALLAGLPVEVGLYASTIPIFVYAFWGSGRILAVGPVAMDSILCAAAVGAVIVEHPNLAPGEQVTLAALLAFMSGVMLILMGVFKLGRMVSLLTPTIISAFTSAAAMIIAINQLKLILGVDLQRSSNVYVVLVDLIHKLDQVHGLTMMIGLMTMVILGLLKRYMPKIPRAFFVVVLAIMTVLIGGLGAKGVQLVGNIPSGLPKFTPPWMSRTIVLELIPHAIVIALIAFMEAFSINSKLQQDAHELDPSRELVALGGANIAAGLFQGYSVTGGFSRSAVNADAGAKSQLASIVTALMVILTLMFFYNILGNIPKAALGAIILTAVIGLISLQDAKEVMFSRRSEIPVYLTTLILTLFVGIKEGLIIGIIVNLMMKRRAMFRDGELSKEVE